MFIRFQNFQKISKNSVFIKFQNFNVYIIILKTYVIYKLTTFYSQYAIYGPVRIILTEDEVNIILAGPYITY